MEHQQAIQQALDEISIAEGLIDESRKKYSEVRKRLEAILSPTPVKIRKTRDRFDKKTVDKLLSKPSRFRNN